MDQNATRSLILSVTAFLLFFVFYMHPYLVNGFWDDDYQNSNVPAFAQRFGSDTLSFAIQVSKEWLTSYGRIIIAWPYIYGFFSLFGDVLHVRIAHVAMVLLDVGLSTWMLRQLRFDRFFCLLYGFCVIAQFQLRNTFDPVAASAGFFTGLHIFLTLSLIFFIRFMESGRNIFLLLSVIIVFISLLSYEINIIYYPIAGALLFLRRKRITTLQGILLCLPVILFIAARTYIRAMADTPYNGSAFGTLEGFLATLPAQFLSVIPLSYYIDSIINTPAYWRTPLSSLNALTGTVFVSSFICILVFSRNPKNSENHPQWLIGVTIAAAFWLLPAILVAISDKYQGTITFGNGYAIIYYQYFGFAFFLATLIHRLTPNKTLPIVSAALLGIVITTQFQVNVDVQQKRDQVFKIPREALETFLQTEDAQAFTDGDILTIEGDYPGADGNTVFRITGKRVYVKNEQGIDTDKWFPGQNQPSADGCHFDLRYRDGKWLMTRAPDNGPLERCTHR